MRDISTNTSYMKHGVLSHDLRAAQAKKKNIVQNPRRKNETCGRKQKRLEGMGKICTKTRRITATKISNWTKKIMY